jgi:hypothetical protein
VSSSTSVRAFRDYIDAELTERNPTATGINLISANEDFGEPIWSDAMKAAPKHSPAYQDSNGGKPRAECRADEQRSRRIADTRNSACPVRGVACPPQMGSCGRCGSRLAS